MSGQPKIIFHTETKQIKISVGKSFYRDRIDQIHIRWKKKLDK